MGTSRMKIIELHPVRSYDKEDMDSASFSYMNCRENSGSENTLSKKVYCPDFYSSTNFLDEWPDSKEFQSVVNEACLDFCNTKGLINTLRLCLDKIKSHFSNLTEYHVELDHFEDDETQDDGHIVFRISVKSDQETLMFEYNQWIDWIIDNIDDDKQPIITLTID